MTQQIDLTTRAMLVTLNISQWTARRHDRAVSEEVAKAHGTADATKTGRYNKILIDPEVLAAVAKLASEARDWHEKQTLPWSDKGPRILPAANYWAYMEGVRTRRVAYDAAVCALVAAYPAALDEARGRLNGLFDEADYPAADDLAERYSFGTRVVPLPDAGDFRVALGVDELASVRADIERDVRKATGDAMRDLWQRAYDAVAKMIERLGAYQPAEDGGKAKGVFRDTLVGNLAELADLLPRLNVTADPNLDALASKLRTQLCQFTPDELRADANKRGQTKQAAAQIIAAMADFMGGAPAPVAAAA